MNRKLTSDIGKISTLGAVHGPKIDYQLCQLGQSIHSRSCKLNTMVIEKKVPGESDDEDMAGFRRNVSRRFFF